MCASPVDSPTLAWTVLQAVDSWQRRHTVAAFPLAVVRKFLDDRGSTLAAVIAYYAFFSLFPLLLVFVSVLGFVLQDNASLQEDVLDSALARIPVVGAQLRDEVEPLTGSTSALVIGLVGALWAGLGVTLALGRAFEEIWDVPRINQRGALRARVRGLVVLAVLAVSLIAATVAAGLGVGGRIGPVAEEVGAVGTALAVNLTAFVGLFALFTPRSRRILELLPGAAVAAMGALALQAAGGWYVERAVGERERYLRHVRTGHRAAVVVLARRASGARGCGGERGPAPSSVATVPGRRSRGCRQGGAREGGGSGPTGRATGDPGPLRRRP